MITHTLTHAHYLRHLPRDPENSVYREKPFGDLSTRFPTKQTRAHARSA